MYDNPYNGIYDLYMLQKSHGQTSNKQGNKNVSIYADISYFANHIRSKPLVLGLWNTLQQKCDPLQGTAGTCC